MIRILSAAAFAALVAIPGASAATRTHIVKHRVHHRSYAGRHVRDAYDDRGYYTRRYDGGAYYPTDPYDVPAYSRTGRVPIGTYGEPVPFRTVQPTDVGIGALAPNGYRGPGTASGGPAGGLNDSGGR